MSHGFMSCYVFLYPFQWSVSLFVAILVFSLYFNSLKHVTPKKTQFKQSNTAAG